MDYILSFINDLDPALRAALITLAIVFVAEIVAMLTLKFLRRSPTGARHALRERAADLSHAPLMLLIPLVAIYALAPLERDALKWEWLEIVQEVAFVLAVGVLTWWGVRFTELLDIIAARKLSLDVADNLDARKLLTQIKVLERVAMMVIVALGLITVLLRYEEVWNLGAGLLASAGVVGIVLGVAARPVVGNLLAGFQIALSQPIRVDDVVIVEGEWGRIEELTLSYVVINIWDQRRLVVPISYFMEKPFQNWTRTNSELLGTVFLRLDYRAPIDAVRQELTRILEGHELWDQRVNKVQVTDATERTIELRCLVSARNAGDAFTLRCDVRERLINFLQQNYPEALPLQRHAIEQDTAHREQPANGHQEQTPQRHPSSQQTAPS